MNYNLQIYKLPKNNNLDIFCNPDKLIINLPIQNHPLFILGYHYFIARTRESLSIIINKLETNNDFYYIVNPFESTIANYDDNLDNLAKIYLKQDIISKDFYKYWEIYFLFDIFPENNSEILILKDTNDNGDIQSIKLYRDKFSDKESKTDKIYKEYNKSMTVDLIILNITINKENDNIRIFIENLIKILKCQKKKGNAILKIGDTYTLPTIKLIYLLSILYEDIYIHKPFFSRPSDNEKYLICKNFNGKDTKKIITNLETILLSSKNNNITDIFLNLTVDMIENMLNIFKFINIKLINYQQIIINEIIKYIKENNYFGDKYHEYRNQQIEATQWWLHNFFPPSNNLYKSNKETLKKYVISTIEKNNFDKDKFISQLI